MGGLMQGGMGGYAIAGGLGSALLWAVALTLVFQVSLLGANLAYLRVSEGIDSSATERAMNERLEQARRKAATAADGQPMSAAQVRRHGAGPVLRRMRLPAALTTPSAEKAPGPPASRSGTR